VDATCLDKCCDPESSGGGYLSRLVTKGQPLWGVSPSHIALRVERMMETMFVPVSRKICYSHTSYLWLDTLNLVQPYHKGLTKVYPSLKQLYVVLFQMINFSAD